MGTKVNTYVTVHCPTREDLTGDGETFARELDGQFFCDCCGETGHMTLRHDHNDLPIRHGGPPTLTIEVTEEQRKTIVVALELYAANARRAADRGDESPVAATCAENAVVARAAARVVRAAR